jgi:hypothetical protein
MLAAKSSSGEGGKKKRRRKRKKGEAEDAETAPAPAAAAAAAVASESLKAKSLPFAPPAPTESITVTNFEGEVEEISMEDIQGVAEFSFKGKTEVPVPPAQAAQDAAASPITPVSSSVQEVDGYIPLPDIRDTLRRKKMEVANKGGPGGPMENNMPKTKIDRNDRVALMKVRTKKGPKCSKIVFHSLNVCVCPSVCCLFCLCHDDIVQCWRNINNQIMIFTILVACFLFLSDSSLLLFKQTTAAGARSLCRWRRLVFLRTRIHSN